LTQELKRTRSVHYTFRLNHEIFSTVQKDAESKGVSTSGLINQILAQYMNRDRYFDQLGFIPTSKEVLRALTDRVDEKLLVEDSRILGESIRNECIPYIYDNVDKETLIQFLELWCGKFKSFKHETNGQSHIFAINHGISRQFSVHLRELLRGLIEPIIPGNIDFLNITPNFVNFAFKL
jgi:hypothetical protein